MKTWFASLVLCTGLSAEAVAEDRALIVGIEGYPQLDLRLSPQSAQDDAIAMAELAVERWGFAQTQVTLLLGSAATSDAILNALIDEVVGLTGPGDRALVYFAGLGSRNTAGDRVILAYDSESLLGRIPEDALSDILDLIADREVMVVVDAGFSGEIATPGQRGIGPPGFETTPFAANGDLRAVYSASTSTQSAWETAAGGVLTRALIEGARGTADADRNGQITHGELLSHVSAASRRWCDTRAECQIAGLTPDFAGPRRGGPLHVAPAAPDPAPATTLPNSAGLDLSIDGGTVLTIGQSVTFRIRSGVEGQFVLLDIAPDGALAQVFPSSLAPGTRIAPGADVVIPAAVAGAAPLRVRVTGPTGNGMLIALLIPGDAARLGAALPPNAGPDRAAFLARLSATLDGLATRAWSGTTLPYTIMETQ